MTVLLCGESSKETASVAERLGISLRDGSPALNLEVLFTMTAGLAGSYTPDTSFPAHTLTLEECLTKEASRPSVRRMSDLVQSEKFASVKFVALKLLNRHDFTGTFRLLEREVFLHSALLAVLEFLTSMRPNLVVFPVTPHQFLPYVVSEVARFLGMKTLFFQPCPFTFAVVPRTFAGRVEIPVAAAVRSSSVAREVMTIANEQILKLQNSVDPEYMRVQRSADERATKLGSRRRAFFRTLTWIYRERFPQAINFSGHGPSNAFFRGLARVILNRSLAETLREAAGSSGSKVAGAQPFAVFALHYEPERTSLPEGLPVEFQGDAVTHINALLPKNFSLVVKEHYSQQSTALRGFLGRSPIFYRAMKSYPGTSFASVQSKLTDLLRGAEVIFTLTGTVAIEAVFAGKPVGYFGSPWWEGMPGTIRVEPGVGFEQIMSVAVTQPDDVVSFLSELVAARMIPGVASESGVVVESRLGQLPKGFFSAEAESLAEIVRTFVKENSLR